MSGVAYLTSTPLNGGQVTGGQNVNGDHTVNGIHCVDGSQSVNGDQSVTGEHLFEIANSWLQKARKRLSLSLKRSNITGDKKRSPGNLESEKEHKEG